jgi:hypothetical protein
LTLNKENKSKFILTYLNKNSNDRIIGKSPNTSQRSLNTDTRGRSLRKLGKSEVNSIRNAKGSRTMHE